MPAPGNRRKPPHRRRPGVRRRVSGFQSRSAASPPIHTPEAAKCEPLRGGPFPRCSPARLPHAPRRRGLPSQAPPRHRRSPLRQAAVAAAPVPRRWQSWLRARPLRLQPHATRPLAQRRFPRKGHERSHPRPAAAQSRAGPLRTPRPARRRWRAIGFGVPPKRPASAAAAPSSAIRPTMRIQRLATSRRDHGRCVRREWRPVPQAEHPHAEGIRTRRSDARQSPKPSAS